MRATMAFTSGAGPLPWAAAKAANTITIRPEIAERNTTRLPPLLLRKHLEAILCSKEAREKQPLVPGGQFLAQTQEAWEARLNKKVDMYRWLRARFSEVCGTNLFGTRNLYQGTTSVVPKKPNKNCRFKPEPKPRPAAPDTAEKPQP